VLIEEEQERQRKGLTKVAHQPLNMFGMHVWPQILKMQPGKTARWLVKRANRGLTNKLEELVSADRAE